MWQLFKRQVSLEPLLCLTGPQVFDSCTAKVQSCHVANMYHTCELKWGLCVCEQPRQGECVWQIYCTKHELWCSLFPVIIGDQPHEPHGITSPLTCKPLLYLVLLSLPTHMGHLCTCTQSFVHFIHPLFTTPATPLPFSHLCCRLFFVSPEVLGSEGRRRRCGEGCGGMLLNVSALLSTISLLFIQLDLNDHILNQSLLVFCFALRPRLLHVCLSLPPQVGWSTARDYYTFLWSPMPENYEPGSTVHRTVVFQGTHTQPPHVPGGPLHVVF